MCKYGMHQAGQFLETTTTIDSRDSQKAPSRTKKHKYTTWALDIVPETNI